MPESALAPVLLSGFLGLEVEVFDRDGLDAAGFGPVQQPCEGVPVPGRRGAGSLETGRRRTGGAGRSGCRGCPGAMRRGGRRWCPRRSRRRRGRLGMGWSRWVGPARRRPRTSGRARCRRGCGRPQSGSPPRGRPTPAPGKGTAAWQRVRIGCRAFARSASGAGSLIGTSPSGVMRIVSLPNLFPLRLPPVDKFASQMQL